MATLSKGGSSSTWQPNSLFHRDELLEGGFSKAETQHDRSSFTPKPLAEAITKPKGDAPIEMGVSDPGPLEPLEPLEIAPASVNIDEQLQVARQEAFAEGETKGLVEGRRQAQEELLEHQEQFEIEARDELRTLMSAIREGLTHHNNLAKPLKRLSVSLAEHIARAELQISDESINNLIGRVVNELEPSELKNVIITISPSWEKRIDEKLFKGLLDDYEVRVSEELSAGSVRLSIEDRAIEDLIENRISEIASQVFNTKFSSSIELGDEQDDVRNDFASADEDQALGDDQLNLEALPASEEAYVTDENTVNTERVEGRPVDESGADENSDDSDSLVEDD